MTSEQTPSHWAFVYVTAVVTLGFATIVESLYNLASAPASTGYRWLLLASLTLLSGSATVKLPSVPATISVSETFVFTAVLLFGRPAATITVALDGFVISLWLARRVPELQRVLFNVAAPALSIWLASQVFTVAGVEPLVQQPLNLQELILPLLLFTVAYFSLNSWLIAFAIALEKRSSPLNIWRDNFLWLSLNYFSGASVAALFVVYTRELDLTYLSVILPLLLVLYLTFKTSMGRVEDANKHLTQLNSLYLSTIETLAMAIDAKDQITHGHIRRVQIYAVGLAKALGLKDERVIKAIEAAALLHDMGKLAVPEHILNKPGKLTPAEFEKMKLHASVGADILSSIDFPYPVVPMVRHHHENWAGGGYPDGLKGTNIPIGARILAVVDCFDALTSDRPYRPRLSDEAAIAILLERRGTMYDPLVVDTFVKVHSEIAPEAAPEEQRRAALTAITESAQPLVAETNSGESHPKAVAATSDEMLALYELAHTLAGHVRLSDAAEVIAKRLCRLVPASLAVFYVHDQLKDELVVAHSVGDDAAVLEGLRIPLGQRLTGWVAVNRQTIVNSDAALDLGELTATMRSAPRSCLSTALVTDGQLVGVLTLYAALPGAFNDDHRRIIEIVARQIAETVQRSIAFEVAQSELSDPQTGLPGVEHLHQLTSRDDRPGPWLATPFSLLCLRFTSDDSGADSAPQSNPVTSIVEQVRRCLRVADVVFRAGPDELVVLLPHTDSVTSHSILARISARLACGNHRRGHGAHVPIEIAAVSAPNDGDCLVGLLETAKTRLSAIEATAQPPLPSQLTIH
jgi:putative nucleotidyltransferase with HDIG domain